MGGNYEILISRINEFTRKFYLNKLLRGLIYTLAVLSASYLLSFLLVYYLQPVPLVKTLLFFFCVLVVCAVLVISVLRPGLAYLKLTQNLSLEQSAAMIGNHFSPVRDKLLNTLQLKALADLSPQQNQLILAGIDQKIEELKLIPFSTAIRLGDNKKYVKYFLIPLVLIIAIGIIAPAVLREGTHSFVAYDQEIIPPAPFNFVVNSPGLTVTQGDDLNIEVKLTGDQLPQDIYMISGLNTFKLEKETISRFHYTFKNLQKNLVFHLSGGGYASKTYQVTVKPRPAILSIQATLIYPSYLKRKNETVSNAGDLLLPEGTTVNWHIFAENTGTLLFKMGDQATLLSLKDNAAVFKSVQKSSLRYQIAAKNDFALQTDTISHQIEVIADQPPAITVQEKADSVSSKAIYFSGEISDDHGFSALKFVYQIKANGKTIKKVSTGIPLNPALLQNNYFYYWNLNNIAAAEGQTIEYYLEVADNDGVNGPKYTRTATKNFSPPDRAQISRQATAASSSLKQQMGSAIKLAAQVEKDSKKIRESFLDKKSLSFEDKKEIGQLLEKQKKLEEAVEKIQQAKNKNSFDQAENKAFKEELADKQKKIDDLFNHVLDPKTKEMLEKLQALMDQNNKNQLQDELSKMSMDNKSLKNELDRILELYRQLEFEQNLKDKVDRLKELAKAQKELSGKSAAKKTEAAELKKQQEKQIAELDALKKELKQLEEKNQELDRPNPFRTPEKEMQSVQEQQQKSMEKLDKNQLQKAAEMQEQTAKQLQDMAEKMEQENQQSEEKENNLNSAELRKLLQNLLQTSFDQEKLMLSLRKMALSDPLYNGQVQQQKQIRDNMKTIADSLASLSKRVPQIESTVTEEMQQINFNLDKGLENLADRQKSEAGRNQQYAMTSINNLALMLNEVLDQLDKNKKNQQKGGKGKSKGSMQQLQQMQQQLNKNMEKARQQMQQQGNQGTVPKGSMSEEFAKMAQQQQMIREALQKINQEENKDGKNSLGNLNQIVQDMKATENELINKRIESETLKRQEGLVTKLLDADRAMREQDEDSKRESKAGTDLPPSYRQQYMEFKKKQGSGQELIEKLPPAMNYYYKNKITDYFKLLNLPK